MSLHDAARAAFYASLPRGKNDQLVPGHSTWDMLGPQAKERHRRIAQAVLDTTEAVR